MKTKKQEEQQEVVEQMQGQEQINPDDIVFTSESDEDMPQPETETYEEPEEKKTLKLSFLFMKLFEECMGKMPYASVLKNSNNDSIKWIDLVRFIEAKKDAIQVSELNTIISFIANSPGEFVRPLMEIIEDTPRQSELWTLTK